MEQGNVLEARNITKVYPGGVVANHNVNLEVRKGERVLITGENGSGKSTIARLLVGLLAPDRGTIAYNGQNIASVDVAALREKGIQEGDTVSIYDLEFDYVP